MIFPEGTPLVHDARTHSGGTSVSRNAFVIAQFCQSLTFLYKKIHLPEYSATPHLKHHFCTYRNLIAKILSGEAGGLDGPTVTEIDLKLISISRLVSCCHVILLKISEEIL